MEISYIINAVIFSVIGLVLFAVAFAVLDRLTPYNLWAEITQKQNVALAIIVGSAALGLSIIIAAAIH